MTTYKFLMPVGVAAAALVSAQASTASVSLQAPSKAVSGSRNLSDPVVEEIKYQIGTEEHGLLMKRSDDGEVYAYHRSHRSHRSHSSHRSSSH